MNENENETTFHAQFTINDTLRLDSNIDNFKTNFFQL